MRKEAKVAKALLIFEKQSAHCCKELLESKTPVAEKLKFVEILIKLGHINVMILKTLIAFFQQQDEPPTESVIYAVKLLSRAGVRHWLHQQAEKDRLRPAQKDHLPPVEKTYYP